MFYSGFVPCELLLVCNMLRALHPLTYPNESKNSCFHEEPHSDQEASSEPELLRQCKLTWLEQGDDGCVDADRAALLGYRFCVLLSLESQPCCYMVLACLRMLAQCGYDFDDIEVAFGMAVAMMQSKHVSSFTEKMGAKEKLLVALLHVYCAHSLVFDQFVHFHIWHEWLFAPFCSEKNSSAALRKVCALRRWRFCVPADVLEPVLAALRCQA